MKHRPGHSQAEGFTLIEVLVALTIVAVTLGAGIRVAGALTNNVQRMQEITAAQWCAENELTDARLRALKAFPAVGDSDISCQQLGLTYPGKLSIRPTVNPAFRVADVQMQTPEGRPILRLSTTVIKQN